MRMDHTEVDINTRILHDHARSPHAALYARGVDEWAADLGRRLRAVTQASPSDLPARLHELRSLSHVVGARGLATAAALLEQRVEDGDQAGPDDFARLTAVAEAQRVALVAWWRYAPVAGQQQREA